jgi:hypothetical protein
MVVEQTKAETPSLLGSATTNAMTAESNWNGALAIVKGTVSCSEEKMDVVI